MPVFAVVAGPTLVWLFLFFAAPLGLIWTYSLGENVSLTEIETTWTLRQYARIFEPEILTLLWRSLWLSALAALLCIASAYPTALIIATARATWKPWLLLLIILPFWTNLLIRTYALLNILSARGRINETLRAFWEGANGALNTIGLGDMALLGARWVPIEFLGTELGVVIGLVYVALPFAILPIYASLERLDKSYLEASMDLGAGRLRTFFQVLVPMTAAGAAAAAILTFIPTLGSFLIPDLLGRGQVDMIANVIERQFKKANDWPFGAALSLMLFYAAFVALAIRAWAEMSRSRDERA